MGRYLVVRFLLVGIFGLFCLFCETANAWTLVGGRRAPSPLPFIGGIAGMLAVAFAPHVSMHARAVGALAVMFVDVVLFFAAAWRRDAS